MVFRPIIGTLVYLLDRESNSVLLIKRDARPQDDHYGKFNGLGGKLELDESVVAGACREFEEESGAVLKHLSLRGTITWSNFGPKREEWLGFIFLAESWEGEIVKSNEEGSLVWVKLDRLLQACAFAWLRGLKADARGLAEELIELRPDFAAQWEQILEDFGD